MTAAAIDLLLARRAAESEMRERCVIVDPEGGAKVWNPTTLRYDTTTAVIYEGRCKIRFGKVGVRQGETAGQLYAEQDATLSLPFSEPTSGDVRKDHVATITAAENDPALVGVTVTLKAARMQSNATSRRFPIKETQ
jgi:hypothetical protein